MYQEPSLAVQYNELWKLFLLSWFFVFPGLDMKMNLFFPPLSLQEFWWTGRVSTSTSSWPAVPSLPPPQCSSLCLSACWTEKRGIPHSSLSLPRCPSKGGRLLAWLQAANTAVCPQRATKRKPQLMAQTISPASNACSRISLGWFPKYSILWLFLTCALTVGLRHSSTMLLIWSQSFITD